MQLKSFSVEGYKIFKDKFIIDFLDGKDGSQFTTLTGKNNSGKSTLLEAINKFFEKISTTNKIPEECFNKKFRE
ncbi:TPA: AAA family ATPase [Streptococcus suis]|nr:AAA family ATPase [Streptococcus suis]